VPVAEFASKPGRLCTTGLTWPSDSVQFAGVNRAATSAF